MPPRILLVGGHDPSGGAGLVADHQVAEAHHIVAHSVVSCLTIQDEDACVAIAPPPPAIFADTLRFLLARYRYDAIKIGALVSGAQAETLVHAYTALTRRPPLVLDPILRTSTGRDFAAPEALSLLSRHALLATPNRGELRQFGSDNPLASRWLLTTNTDEAQQGGATHATCTLSQQGALQREWDMPLMPGVFHGSGCLLASAIACRLAQQWRLETAVDDALRQTAQRLRHRLDSCASSTP